MDKHCRGCKHHWKAGHPKDSPAAKKHNDWCCKVGQSAKSSIGHCKVHNLKEPK